MEKKYIVLMLMFLIIILGIFLYYLIAKKPVVIKYTSIKGEKCKLKLYEGGVTYIYAPESFFLPEIRVNGKEFRFTKMSNILGNRDGYLVQTPDLLGMYFRIGYIVESYTKKNYYFISNSYHCNLSDRIEYLICYSFITSEISKEQSIYDIDTYLYGLKENYDLGKRLNELSGFITKSYYMYIVWLNSGNREEPLSNDKIVELSVRLENLYLNGNQGLSLDSLAFILVNNQEWTDDEIYENYSDDIDFGY